MTIIADSGSTKTDWTVTGPCEKKLSTQGLNPVLMTKEQMTSILRCELLPQMEDLGCMKVAQEDNDEKLSVFFYGAGVRPEMEEKMSFVLQSVFQPLNRKIEVSAASDLLGAARALCGHNEGIACILGTGANSCLYNGRFIVGNTPALGYILGDEGGGAALGKAFLNALFKGGLPETMRDDYLKQSRLTLEDIIRKVYREPMPNRFLASTSLYIGAHINHPGLRQIVTENFRLFLRRNVKPYNRPDLPVSFVGSIASHYEQLLCEAAQEEGFILGKIMKSPIEGLVEYHHGQILSC